MLMLSRYAREPCRATLPWLGPWPGFLEVTVPHAFVSLRGHPLVVPTMFEASFRLIGSLVRPVA